MQMSPTWKTNTTKPSQESSELREPCDDSMQDDRANNRKDRLMRTWSEASHSKIIQDGRTSQLFSISCKSTTRIATIDGARGEVRDSYRTSAGQ